MTDDLVKVIEENPLAKGVTLVGEPFSQAEAFAELAGKLRTGDTKWRVIRDLLWRNFCGDPESSGCF